MKHIIIRNAIIEDLFNRFKLEQLVKGKKFKSDEEVIKLLLSSYMESEKK